MLVAADTIRARVTAAASIRTGLRWCSVVAVSCANGDELLCLVCVCVLTMVRGQHVLLGVKMIQTYGWLACYIWMGQYKPCRSMSMPPRVGIAKTAAKRLRQALCHFLSLHCLWEATLFACPPCHINSMLVGCRAPGQDLELTLLWFQVSQWDEQGTNISF